MPARREDQHFEMWMLNKPVQIHVYDINDDGYLMGQAGVLATYTIPTPNNTTVHVVFKGDKTPMFWDVSKTYAIIETD